MTDHELNKLLAEVAGVNVVGMTSENLPVWACISDQDDKRFNVWTPLHNHHQMALVKAGLREQGFGYHVSYWSSDKTYRVEIFAHPQRFLGVTHHSELRAFAEAVAQMKGETP